MESWMSLEKPAAVAIAHTAFPLATGPSVAAVVAAAVAATAAFEVTASAVEGCASVAS